MDLTSTQLYISLLEKTNQQLSLWSNPYGVLVSVLSFLVAFLAIAAAVILYRQTREYKELYQTALKSYENTLQENLKKIGIDADNKIQLFIDTKTKEIDTLSGDTKKQAKKIIDDLKNEKDSISSRIQFSSVGENQYNHQPLKFSLNDSDIFKSYGIAGESNRNILGISNYCPKCGSYCGSSGLLMLKQNYCSNCGVKL